MANRFYNLAACFCGQGDDYQRPLLEAITEACASNQIRISVFLAFSETGSNTPTPSSVSSIFSLMNLKKFDGLVLFPLYFTDHDLIRELIARAKAEGIPVICVDGEEEGCFNIKVDEDVAIELITSHFIETHGFTRINYIGGTPGIPCSESREASYRRAMKAHSLPVEEKRIGCGMFWKDEACAYIRNYYETYQEIPEAIVCANDSMALAVIDQLKEMGFSVPGDVCVSGLDGLRRSLNHTPSLTTAAPNLAGAAKLAVRKFLEIAGGSCKPIGTANVPCKLYFEESCGCKSAETQSNSRVLQKLFDEIDNQQHFLFSEKLMMELLTGVSTLEEFRQKVEKLANGFWTGRCWICLCDDYFATDVKEKRTHGYTKMIQPFAHMVEHQAIRQNDFPMSEMVPGFDEVFNFTQGMLFVPLYFRDEPIGYIASAYGAPLTHMLDMLRNFACALSILLENARIRLQLENMVDRFQNLSTLDAMTGLCNRRGFYMNVNTLFEECVRTHSPFLSIAIDLDGLKAINDNYGHKEGDNAILMMATLLQQVCKDDRLICARFGGDEFVVAGRYDVNSHPEQIVHRIESRLRDINMKSGREYAIGMSSGWYLETPGVDNCIDEWIAISDERMYSVKKTHKNRGRSRR